MANPSKRVFDMHHKVAYGKFTQMTNVLNIGVQYMQP